MQRSKQQALMFLLGAALVGGVLGFSADRYLAHEKVMSEFGPRPKFYDALGLSQQQQYTLDSIAYAQDCVMKAVMAPVQPKVDSIRAEFRTQFRQVFTPEQQAQLDARRKEREQQRQAELAKEPKRQCSANH
jgi:Spy/CpxP family protein refolding chaperone